MAKKSVAQVVKTDNGDGACLLCHRADLPEVEFGKLHKLGNLRAHYYCLLFSSGLQQSGKHDHQGILGFMPRDIMCEINRGKRLRCCYCKHPGATVGCVFKKCRRTYHLPCGLNNGVMLQFFGSFPTYCIDHRFYQSPVKWDKKKDVWCSLCLEHIVPEVSADTLYPPCCKNGWFHKLCVQMQALKAGYFFRCPLCNNTSIFNEAMSKFGVHIPEQDAAWETEPGAFQDMYVQHSNCDVPTCICPNGRKYDEDTIGKSPWELVRCKTCGSQGTHIGCSKLPLSQPEWMCTMCTPVVASKETPSEKQDQESYNFRTRVGRTRENARRIRGNGQKPSRFNTRKRKISHQLPSRSSSSSSSSSCSPPPVHVTNSLPPGCVVSKEKSVELVKYFGARGYRETRNSDSDMSDDCKRGFKLQRSSSPNSDSNSDSEFHNKKQSSPNFHLKRPASFGSPVDSVSDVHPMKKPYFSSSANPLTCPSSHLGQTNQNHSNGCSPNKITMRQLFQHGWHGYSGSTVFLQTSEEDEDNKPMPVLLPSKEPELIVIDSSDEGEVVSKPNRDTVQESGVQSLSSNDKVASPTGNKSRSSSSEKESEVENLSPTSIKNVASGEKSCIPKESGYSGQESILKYMHGTNSMQPSVVPTKTKPRKRSPKSAGSMKITSFYQSASKTFSVGFSDEDDDNTVPMQ